MEEKIEKYMPFVFFGEGERPEPQMEEQVKGTYKIYQLPNGEKYHGIRFESKEQLEKEIAHRQLYLSDIFILTIYDKNNLRIIKKAL